MKFEAEGVTIFNCDCMDILRAAPDDSFDLAIVDPPYDLSGQNTFVCKSRQFTNGRASAHLDASNLSGYSLGARPGAEFFRELRRVSRNQIVFGGQYFSPHLEAHGCWLVWDKMNGASRFSDAELAATSFDRAVRIFRKHVGGETDRIHPTQKPVELYAWCLRHYAQPGQRILDTHLGSGSIAIACRHFGASLVAAEIDPIYFAAATERFKRECAQSLLSLGGGGGFSEPSNEEPRKSLNMS